MFFESFIPYLIALICFPLIIYHKEIGNATGLVDFPDDRKKHKKPIPKVGGIYILITTICTMLYFSNLYNERFIISYFVIVIGLFFIGFIDDKIEINATNRLIMQLIVTAIAITIDFNLNITNLNIGIIDKKIQIFHASTFFTIFCVIALVNATNLVDGKDGLLGSIFLFFLIIFIYSMQNEFNYILISLLISTILFLIYNIRGVIFLGNSGSYLIGGIMAFITIQSYNYEPFQIEIIFSIFYLFGLDMLRVYIERLLKGISPFTAENNHLHHYIYNCFKNKLIAILTYMILAIIPFVYQIFFTNFIIIIFLCFFIYIFSFLFFKKYNNSFE